MSYFTKFSVANFFVMRRIHVLTFLQFQIVNKLRYTNIKDDFNIVNKLCHSKPDPDPKLLLIQKPYLHNEYGPSTLIGGSSIAGKKVLYRSLPAS
jgi:hypothetical protein